MPGHPWRALRRLGHRPLALWPLIGAVIWSGCTPKAPGAELGVHQPTLAELLRCNDSTVGGDALRAATEVSYDLAITEANYSLTGHYRASRDGTMRIDVFLGTDRVFSEGLDGDSGWQLPRGATVRTAIGPDASTPLRHGLEQPGHLWTLADMPRNGHQLTLVDPENGALGTATVQLTLRDGFETWYTVDPASCLVIASRSFRAFHPDIDSTQRWIETRLDEFERHDGVLRPMVSYNVDLTSGDTIARTRVTEVRLQQGPARAPTT